MQEFPEIDRSAWLPVPEARTALARGQVPFLDRLMAHLAQTGPDGEPHG
jgi:predicted NUDIX family NTP pyrophosphohydrolase